MAHAGARNTFEEGVGPRVLGMEITNLVEIFQGKLGSFVPGQLGDHRTAPHFPITHL